MSKDTPDSEWSTRVAADRGMSDEYKGTVDVGYAADESVGQHGRESTAESQRKEP